ncbi:VCBS repeat-containing protein [Acrocarpospora sp. B8E8]|uniref:FG-GAP repeat domain-containing protein n=1 Tax=Acrocarpospora sp. B8E8 TaxID=3153572 RepID=UPI00325FB31B
MRIRAGAGRAAAIVLAAVLMLLTGVTAPANATVPGFQNVQNGNAWIDVNGDNRADGCRVFASTVIMCTLSTGTGFGNTFAATGDLGYGAGRAWADFNGDRAADYCRVVGAGYQNLQCTVSVFNNFGQTFTSGAVDPGYDAGRAWVDFNGDGKADYCRVVGFSSKSAQCTVSGGDGWDDTFQSASLDPGYDAGRSWVDANGDGKADFCRIVGLWDKNVQCTFSTGTGFGRTVTSAALDPGYDDSRRWGDVNGDGKADYCRIVGNFSLSVRCTLSTGNGFGNSFTSAAMDTGYGGTGAWADVNGDGKDDYCRDTGGNQGTCTLSNGSSFGTTFSGTGPGSQTRWADFNADGKADFCQFITDAAIACRVSLGTSFGATFRNN